MVFPKRTTFALFWRDGGWMFMVVILVALAFAVFAVSARREAQSLTRDGRDAMGVITQKYQRMSGTSSSRSRTTTYYVRYTFKNAAGAQVKDIQDVSDAFYHRVKDGDQLQVRYLPEHPTTSEIEQGRAASASILWEAVALAIFIGGLIGLIVWLRRARARVMLRDHGVSLQAIVTAHDLIKRGKNRKLPPKHGRALWRDDADGTGRTLVHLIGDLPAVKQDIVIFADPLKKQRSVWEGDVGSR